MALSHVDYDEVRDRQDALREEGRYLGVAVSIDDVEVREGDTTETNLGLGTFGSRVMPVAGSPVRDSAEEAREIAADHLEASVKDVAFEDGAFHIRGAPERSVSIAEVARLAGDEDETGGSALSVTSQYDPSNNTYPPSHDSFKIRLD